MFICARCNAILPDTSVEIRPKQGPYCKCGNRLQDPLLSLQTKERSLPLMFLFGFGFSILIAGVGGRALLDIFTDLSTGIINPVVGFLISASAVGVSLWFGITAIVRGRGSLSAGGPVRQLAMQRIYAGCGMIAWLIVAFVYVLFFR